MAWIDISGTNWQYDNDAENNLPTSRLNFWNKQSGITINNGVRIKSNGIEIYIRVKKKDVRGDPPYKENELNKTYIDK